MELDQEVERIAALTSWSDAEAKRVVAAWQSSGESRAAFGRRYGIHVHRLYFWIAKFAERKAAGKRKRVRFHPVEMATPTERKAPVAPIEIRSIRIPGGFDPGEVRTVLELLDSRD
jgi:transposase-like protein